MPKITPFLWFDNRAEEAMRFYVSIFKDSKITKVTHYLEGTPMPAGTVMTVEALLAGQPFVALNGGPVFQFTPAVSFVINCDDQAEVDHYWDALLAGGTAQQCGWLTDKFGVTWQVVPTVLDKLLSDPDPVKAQRVMDAVLKMVKLDIAALERARDGA